MNQEHLIKAYIATYQPIVDRFCESIDLGLPTLDKMSSPFIPLYGRDYEKSAKRLIFVGIDTYGWQNGVRDFVETHRKDPKAWINDLMWFQEAVPFTDWGPRRTTFWGFIMGFMASIYGIEDWGIFKRGMREDILTSVAWGNVNAIENYESTAKGKGVDAETWRRCREASSSFWGVRPIIDGLRPNVIVVLNRKMKPSEYFNGLEWKVIRDENGCRHYHLPECQVDVLHVPHPNNMRWEGGESPFRITLVSWLQELNLFIKPDSFFQGGIESSFAKSIINGMPALCKNDKFMALEYISHELAKGNCIMSVRTLSEIINAMGLKTNYGTSFMGGRGTYRLIMSAYWRLERQGKHIEAIALARSFVRPNGHYAYAADPHIAIRANN